MAPREAGPTDDFSDGDSSSPLLPPPASSSLPSSSSADSTPKRSRLAALKSWRWYHPVLALAGAGIVLLAFDQAYTGRSERWSGIEDGERDPHFPSRVGYAGPTPTGAEAFAAATSYPSMHDSFPLNPPASLKNSDFNILDYLGNLSPWHTVNHGLKGTAQVPEGCEVEEVQLLHRHGARYPTSGSSTETFYSSVVAQPGFKASGQLAFLNNWKHLLGGEILTPFGRSQLFNLGASFRVKYGHLLKEGQRPVFRTESQDRMLNSALNFALGFWGLPLEDKYHQLVTIEWPGFNNTLAPYMTCSNSNRADLTRGPKKMAEWMEVYLKDALGRVQGMVEGVELKVKDLFNMQLLCAYELVALGGSAFCPIFTEDEWKGFEYAHDIMFWEIYSFGHPASAAAGKGWVQEWLARTMKQPLGEFNSTTNATLHTNEYFPLDQKLYVDATHDTIISAVITTLKFTSFARSGPLPTSHIPANLSFVTSSISPFAANLHSQILSCPSSPLVPKGGDARFVRWILNDGVVPLDHIDGCETNDDGLCSLEAFVRKTRENVATMDFGYDCLTDYPRPSSPVTDGRPPRPSS